MTVHGYPEEMWARAKDEAKAVLTAVARARDVIPYSDLTARITSISFLATDQRFFYLLREISAEEERAGRGMLTAVVVHKRGDFKPGPGFFELARGLGLDTTDTERLWVEQIAKAMTIGVHNHRSGHHRHPSLAAKEEIEQQRVTAFMAALLGHEVLTKDSAA